MTFFVVAGKKAKSRKGKSKEAAAVAAAGTGGSDKRRVAKATAAVAKGPKPRPKKWHQRIWHDIRSLVDGAITDLFGRKGKKVFYALMWVSLVLVLLFAIARLAREASPRFVYEY